MCFLLSFSTHESSAMTCKHSHFEAPCMVLVSCLTGVCENCVSTQAPDLYIKVTALLHKRGFCSVKELIVSCWFEQYDLLWLPAVFLSCTCVAVYPCPLFSVRFRKPLFGETGHTIMNLLAVSFLISLLLLHFAHGLLSIWTHSKSSEAIWLFPRVYRTSEITSTRCRLWRGWWWTWKWGRRASRYRATVIMRWMKTSTWRTCHRDAIWISVAKLFSFVIYLV